jgi:hypothetical protein
LAEELVFDSREGQENFLFYTLSTQTLWLTRLISNRYRRGRAFSWG